MDGSGILPDSLFLSTIVPVFWDLCRIRAPPSFPIFVIPKPSLFRPTLCNNICKHALYEAIARPKLHILQFNQFIYRPIQKVV